MKGTSEPDVLVEAVCEQLSFIDDLKKLFECVICRTVAKAPIISTCCHRVIGCAECVEQWRRTHSRCPLCSQTGHMMECFGLKGIEGISSLFRAGEASEVITPSPTVDVEANSEDDFEDLPAFSTSS